MENKSEKCIIKGIVGQSKDFEYSQQTGKPLDEATGFDCVVKSSVDS